MFIRYVDRSPTSIKMSLCNAFRKSDLQPCQNHARHGHTTCSSHKHFYNKDQWKRMFFSLDSPFLPTGVGYEQATLVGRIETAILYALANCLVVLTQADCAAIPCPPPNQFNAHGPTAVDLWTILVSSGKVSPTWNMPLTKFAIFTFAKMRTPFLIDVAPSLERRLGVFLSHPAVYVHKVLENVLAYLHCLIGNYPCPESLKQGAYRLVVDEFTDHPSFGGSLLLSDSCLTENLNNIPKKLISDEQRAFLINIVLTAVKGKRQDMKAFHHTRVEIFKEELVMKVFHPTRVEKWLEEGGFELLDMMF